MGSGSGRFYKIRQKEKRSLQRTWKIPSAPQESVDERLWPVLPAIQNSIQIDLFFPSSTEKTALYQLLNRALRYPNRTMKEVLFVRTNSYSIFDFLRSCGGDWRNTLYIPCGVCIHPCRAKQRGVLMTADSYGRPQAISVARYEAITGQRIDPDECVGTLRQYAFDQIFREFAFWKCDQVGDCLLCRLDSEISAGPVQREPRADSEATAPAADTNTPSKRSFVSKLKQAPK